MRVLAHAIRDAQVSKFTGAANGERAAERRWDTRVGTFGLAIPKVRDGSSF